METAAVIVGADLGAGSPRQVRIERSGGDARITAIGEQVDHAGAVIVDAAGGAVLPGFTDHHLHLHAMAVAEISVRCGPPQVADLPQLQSAIQGADTDAHGWVRGIGYIETVAGDLDRHRLDEIDHRRPVRIQHRSGALWFLNSVALQALNAETADHPGIERAADGAPTGRLWRADDWLRSRLPAAGPPSLTAVGERLRRLGIVEITDATPGLDEVAIGNIVSAVDDGAIAGRVHLLGVPLGGRIEHPRITVGPYKIVIADSSLPDLDELTDAIRAAHATGRAVAVHCVSAVAYALLLAAWAEAEVRPGDRIEHAGVVPASSIADLARLGVQVVTQPGFLPDRGDDFLDGTDPAEHVDLYRCGSLLRAGVPVALSSDAPYGPLDPWLTIDAAVRRRTASGRRVGDPVEQLTVAQALACHGAPAADPAAPPRRVAVGARADLVIADRPLAAIAEAPARTRTAQAIIAGISR